MSDDKRDTDTMPRPDGCRCHWEAGDSRCPVHPGHDDEMDPEVEALARDFHDRGACLRYDDPTACDMRYCGAAWFLREAIQAGIELGGGRGEAKGRREAFSRPPYESDIRRIAADAVRGENDACADAVSRSASVHEAFDAIRARRRQP